LVAYALARARDELVKATAAHNEAALGDLLKELRRTFLAEWWRLLV
jgi:hypothetical protein